VQIDEKASGEGGGLAITSVFDRFLPCAEEPAAEESEPPGPAAKKQKKRVERRTRSVSVVVSLASIESISTIR
jgi:hypothetical protein